MAVQTVSDENKSFDYDAFPEPNCAGLVLTLALAGPFVLTIKSTSVLAILQQPEQSYNARHEAHKLWHRRNHSSG